MQTDEKKQINDGILKVIAKSLQGLAFGTVTIKIHNSKIAQLEVTQNKRFDEMWVSEAGGGI